jgi:hypothetical protein
LPIGVPGPIRVNNSLSSRESIRFRPGPDRGHLELLVGGKMRPPRNAVNRRG